jgi:hypothetical protein
MTINNAGMRCATCGSDLVLHVGTDWLCAACMLRELDRTTANAAEIRFRSTNQADLSMLKYVDERIDVLRLELDRFLRCWPTGIPRRSKTPPIRTRIVRQLGAALICTATLFSLLALIGILITM